jgi:hypothetical protein
MSTDSSIVSLEDRKRAAGQERRLVVAGPPSEDAVALAFVRLHGRHYRYVPAWRRWIGWEGKRWAIDRGNAVFDLIRTLIR